MSCRSAPQKVTCLSAGLACESFIFYQSSGPWFLYTLSSLWTSIAVESWVTVPHPRGKGSRQMIEWVHRCCCPFDQRQASCLFLYNVDGRKLF